MKILDFPFFYSKAMELLGAEQTAQELINLYIKPLNGEKILDIGCGPADILSYLPPDIKYTGIDFNERYIETAKEKFDRKGVFILGDIADYDFSNKGMFDIVIAIGVIHHISERDARKLLNDGYKCLKEGGRLITVDNIKEEWIGLINSIALKLDRGKFIRNENEYLNLFSNFPSVHTTITKSNLRIPYHYIICEITKS